MQTYSKESLYSYNTECYGCDKMTTEVSGMCPDCMPADDIGHRGKPERVAHSNSRAFDIIERGARV
jgi:rRNA maturation endonuclease Nob1